MSDILRGIGFVLMGLGVASLIYGFFVFDPQMSAQIDKLKEERDSIVVNYLQSRGLQFENDHELSAEKRVEILSQTHMLTKDDLGSVEKIKNEYSEKIEPLSSQRLNLVLIMAIACFAMMGSTALIFN